GAPFINGTSRASGWSRGLKSPSACTTTTSHRSPAATARRAMRRALRTTPEARRSYTSTATSGRTRGVERAGEDETGAERPAAGRAVAGMGEGTGTPSINGNICALRRRLGGTGIHPVFAITKRQIVFCAELHVTGLWRFYGRGDERGREERESRFVAAGVRFIGGFD